MKWTIFLLTLFAVYVPAMGSVDIVCTPTGPNEVTVSFTSDEAVPVWMISLDVQVDDPNVCVTDVNCVSGECNIYPASISIDSNGTVIDWGTCAGLMDGNAITSALYVGAVNSPPEGDLFVITFGGCTYELGGDVYVTISQSALHGGVVMEDPNLDPTVNLTGCTISVGECDRCPCMGDITDTSGNGPPDGTVNIGDLVKIYSEMVRQYPNGNPSFIYDIGMPVGFECADVDYSGSINFSDLITIYAEMVRQYPNGDPTFTYDIGCPF